LEVKMPHPTTEGQARLRHATFLRLAGWCGVLGPAVSTVMLFHAIAISPWFSWQRNSLSDLAGPGAGASATWFTASVILQGMAMAIAILGVWLWVGPGRLAAASSAVLLVSSAAVLLVGVFPKGHRGPHLAVAATYFLTAPLGLAGMGLAMWRKGRRLHGALTVSAGLAAFLSIAGVPSQGFAVSEVVAGLFVGAWTYAMGVNLLLAA
jgi:hypothetical membrane protein